MFVGKHKRTVQRGGWLRFPKEWLPFLDDRRAVVAMPNPNNGKSVMLVPLDDHNRELERNTERLAITADGWVQIPASLLAYAGIKDVAELSGVVRAIELK